MGKCLVTKLAGSTNNSSLLRLGELIIGIRSVSNPSKASQVFSVVFSKETKLEIIGDGYFTDETLTSNKGKTLTVKDETNIFFSNGNYNISITDKYSLVSLSFSGIGITNTTSERSNKYLNIESLKYSKGLTKLNCSARSVSGNISSLENLTLLASLNLTLSNVSGDIDALKNLTALTYLNLSQSQVSGDIDALKNLTVLTNLNLGQSQVSGDIDALKNLTSLTYLNLGLSNVSGDIDALKNLTSLTSFDFINTLVSGSIDALKNLTSLTSFNIFNTSTPIIGSINSLSGLSKLLYAQIKYAQLSGDLAVLPTSFRFVSFQHDAGSTFTWGTRPSSAKIIAIEGLASLTNIDKMLQDQAQCQIGFTSSDAVAYKTISVAGNRTSASDDAVATLQQKGYTISIAKA